MCNVNIIVKNSSVQWKEFGISLCLVFLYSLISFSPAN